MVSIQKFFWKRIILKKLQFGTILFPYKKYSLNHLLLRLISALLKLEISTLLKTITNSCFQALEGLKFQALEGLKFQDKQTQKQMIRPLIPIFSLSNRSLLSSLTVP